MSDPKTVSKPKTKRVSNSFDTTNQELVINPVLKDIRWIVENSDLCTFDFPLAYQRHFDPWVVGKKNSYIKDVWNGVSAKDLFIIVDIEEVLNNIDPNDSRPSTMNFIATLKEYVENGKKYLVVDGQHRVKLIAEYTRGISWDGHTPFTAIKDTCYVGTEDITTDVGKTAFDKIPNELTNNFYNQPIIIAGVTKATLNGLKRLFITSNDGVPISRQDKRNAGNSNIVDYIRDLANNTIILDHIFNRFNYPGKFSIPKRGHEYISTILLSFEMNPNSPRLNDETRMDSYFDQDHPLYPVDQFKTPIGFAKGILNSHKSNMMTLAEVAKHLSPKFGRQKGRLYNLYMFISLLGLKNMHSLKSKHGITKAYKIVNPEAIADYFMKSEMARELEDRYVTQKDKNGKPVYITAPSTNKKNFGQPIKVGNPLSYYVASHDTRNESSTRLIMDRLLRDVKLQLDKWISMGYIKEVGKNATQSQKEAAMVEHNFSDAFTGEQHSAFSMFESNGIEFDHKLTKSDGHDGEDNLRPISKKANRERSNKKLLRDS